MAQVQDSLVDAIIARLRSTGRPVLIDAFSGEGGAGRGYVQAGWATLGIDRKDTGRRYAKAVGAHGEFLQVEDAIPFLAAHAHKFDAVHSSPPCQGYTIATAGNPSARANHARLIPVTREVLRLTGKPYVIENVEQARREMVDPVLLCGRMFALEAHDEDGKRLVLDRHRLFESNVALTVPPHRQHGYQQVAGVYGGSRRAKRPYIGATPSPAQDRHAARVDRGGGYVPRSMRVRQVLLGIDWMTGKGMEESIPPAYTEYIGGLLPRPPRREYREGSPANG